MLQSIHIQHFALIDQLDIDFREGFSVITGETGSGKSILLGAIGLLLGNRADSKSIQDGQAKCTIEAQFCLRGYHLQSFFDEEGFDYDEDCCIIRRELTAAGKSRAYINDSPASLAQLKQLGNQLIDIHSQHQNVQLVQEAYQIDTLDLIADATPLRQQYVEAYHAMSALQTQLDEMRETLRRSKADQDYMQFQYQQLAELNLQEAEDEDLDAERNELEHAEEIKTSLCQVDETLDGSGASVLSALRSCNHLLHSLARFSPRAEALSERAESCYLELKDIESEVSSLADDVEVNPARLQEVLDRLDAIYDLQQKHGATSVAELLALQAELETKFSAIENADDSLQQLEQELLRQKDVAESLAAELSAKRTQAAKVLEEQCNEQLRLLGMPNACLHVSITQADELRPSGQDRVELLFSANKNGSLQPISNVASGGEIARVMLVLKSITSQHRALPTIIFDEIDTGVSGRIAEAMAHSMQGMAKVGGQVIAITHLPQIAALGNHHYRVYKEDGDESTHSHMLMLSTEERVTELAKMLSGEQITQAAIDNARQLLNLN